jgi:hypothetical protein
MIIYDLQCSGGHTFEGWFDSREEFDREREAERLSCPMCGDFQVRIIPSGGHTPGREKPKETPKGPALQKALSDYLEGNFQDVGNRFAEEAIKMHFGEIDHRNIRGTMTGEEEKDLQEEGVQYMKIPSVKYDS